MYVFKATLLSLLVTSFVGHDYLLAASDYQEQLLTELLLAEPGSVIEIPEGQYEIDVQLSLSVDQVTIRGQGQGKSVLNFKNQNEGGEGLSITGNGVVLEDFTIEDTPGDGIKVSYADGITIRSVEVRWNGGPKAENGAYGFYPVRSRNVLIEGSVVSGASDAGIYVGQSENIIVRRNTVFENVAGIEIENSRQADVYHNYVYANTGGILVFDMPDLKVVGERCRIFGNVVTANNTPNFSPPSNSVGDVPTGTGIMVMANQKVEIFDNLITDHATTNLLLTSYFLTQRPINDEAYDPYVEAIYIYDNSFRNGGFDPKGGSSESSQILVEALKGLIGLPFPDIIWGGYRNPTHIDEVDVSLKEEFKICIQNNHKVSFIDLDLQNDLASLSRDLGKHDCSFTPMEPVTF